MISKINAPIVDFSKIGSEIKTHNRSVKSLNLAAKEESKYEQDLKDETLLNRRQDRELRLKYTDKVFNLICWWLAAVLVILLMDGCSAESKSFDLGNSVLIALIGGATTSVIGLFIIVANYLFGGKNEKADK